MPKKSMKKLHCENTKLTVSLKTRHITEKSARVKTKNSPDRNYSSKSRKQKASTIKLYYPTLQKHFTNGH